MIGEGKSKFSGQIMTGTTAKRLCIKGARSIATWTSSAYSPDEEISDLKSYQHVGRVLMKSPSDRGALTDRTNPQAGIWSSYQIADTQC
jgi:hypothetical protein